MEKFEFYGAPDIEREMMVEGMGPIRKSQPSGAERLWKELRAKRSKGKLQPSEKMVFGKLRRVEDIENELAVLESTNSPFPEVRERRIQELQEELEQLSEQGENYSQMTLGELARVIRRVWKKINYAAQPYVDAMATMDEMDPYKARYIHDPGSDIVARFLVNASTFRGPEAKAIKDELKKRMKRK
jgi:hypothetical protein